MTKILSAVLALALLAAALVVPGPVAQAAAPPDGQYNRTSDVGQIRLSGGLNQRDLVRLLQALRNQVVGTAAANGANLSVGTTTSKIRTNSEIQFRINGATYTKASTDDLCTLAATTALLNTQSAYWRIEIDATGACSATAGPIVTATGTDKTLAVVPNRSANKATLGLFLVQGLAFTPGTTATTADANRIYVNGDPDLIDLLEP